MRTMMSVAAMRLALSQAYRLGQTYWQQADSESYNQYKKAAATDAKFWKLVENTCTAIQEAEACEPVAWMHDCAALLQNGVELWIDRCPHCGKPRTHPPAAPESEDASITENNQGIKMSITAMKRAVAALETIGTMHGEWNNGMHAANVALKVLPALRTAIQEAEACEPDGYYRHYDGGIQDYPSADSVPFYLAPPAAQPVPEGYQLVPVEPTESMCASAREQKKYDIERGARFTLDSNIYRSMLAAVPAAQPAKPLTDEEKQ